MRTVIFAGVGALITLAGIIITLQGVGVIGGSASRQPPSGRWPAR